MKIAAAQEGETLARDWLVRTWTPPVYRFSLRMLNNEQDARDVSQETLVRALKNLHRYDRKRSFATWIFSIARNACIDEHRRRKRRKHSPMVELADPSDSPAAQTIGLQRAARLHEAVRQLSPLYREVIVLYHFEHLKYGEIASVLDIPIGTVMNRIFRARTKLRALYEASESHA